MPELYTLAILAAAALAMQLTPGPDMMLVLGRGIGQGYRIAQATALGIAVAGFVQLPLLAFGVSEIVAARPWLLDVIRVIGAGYLMYLGWKLIRSKRPVTPKHNPAKTSFGRAVFDGAVANLMNPKMIVFQLAFLPQFVDVQSGPIWSQLLVLGVVMKMCGFAVMSTVAVTSGVVGRWMARHPAWQVAQERFVGVMMIAIGFRLMLEFGSGYKPSRV